MIPAFREQLLSGSFYHYLQQQIERPKDQQPQILLLEQLKCNESFGTNELHVHKQNIITKYKKKSEPKHIRRLSRIYDILDLSSFN